jgi:hypothetical protein
MLRQVELNVASLEMSGADQQPVKAVLAICDRFQQVASQFVQRRENRAQDLLRAVLRIHFDDIRTEEWTPYHGGRSSRMDVLLKDHAIVVEAKTTRKGLAAKKLSDQLTIDVAKSLTVYRLL